MSELALTRSDGGAAFTRPAATRLEQNPHTVQFYEDERYLHLVLRAFAETTLERGEVLIVVARPSVCRQLELDLAELHIDVEEHIDAGRIVIVDAEQLLPRLWVNGRIDHTQFEAISTELFRSLGNGRARFYGEMVDLLVERGFASAAVELETLWNGLAGRYSFDLLCGYRLQHFSDQADASAFDAICGVHSHVVPTERYSGVDELDARLREVSSLQQRARALETEISRRERVEADLREALRVREDFLSIAGHELRTPLTALGLRTRLLEREAHAEGAGPLAKKVERYTLEASRHLARLSSLVNELLDVTRISSGQVSVELERVDLTSVLREVATTILPHVERAGCSLQVFTQEGLQVRADTLRLEQVLTNVLENAIKYGRGKPVELRVLQEGSLARIRVSDQGIGIEAEHLERIFERFERATPDRGYGGIGLGLYITRTMMERMGGTVEVESSRGIGSTFTLTLPLEPT